MKRRAAVIAVVVLCALRFAHAEYVVEKRGAWPKSWPAELEPLRKQSRTLEGPVPPQAHYEIPFTKRDEFEAAWPHLLKVKSKGAPIILIRAPKTDFFAIKPAGVLIHSPGTDTDEQADSKKRACGSGATDSLDGSSTYIELVVDGQIVDLNRIPLPPDTPIIDNRFKDEKTK